MKIHLLKQSTLLRYQAAIVNLQKVLIRHIVINYKCAFRF